MAFKSKVRILMIDFIILIADCPNQKVYKLFLNKIQIIHLYA